MERWTAYCMTCKDVVRHNGESVDWPNGSMVEAAAKIHAGENDHEVLIGYRMGHHCLCRKNEAQAFRHERYNYDRDDREA